MARKRGGLAGLWDRNKGVIKTVAPFAAGFIPGAGPMIAAGLGAAMGGLDRPGKGGIGLDLGGAVKGGVSGYGAGKLGQMTRGGLGKMFTAGGSSASSAPRSATNYLLDAGEKVAGEGGGSGAGKMAGVFGKGGYLERNQQMLGGAAKGISDTLGNAAAGQAAGDRLALDQSKFDYEKEQDLKAQEKRRRLAQLTGQMFAPQIGQG